MYRYLVILSVLIVSLSACGSNETPQAQHDASLSKALTTTSVTAAEESTTSTACPITKEECATMAENGCPKAGTADCPMTAEGCDKAGTPDCPKAATQGCDKAGTADCPMTAEGCDKAGTADCPKAATQGCDKAGTADCPKAATQGCDSAAAMATESATDQVEGAVTDIEEVDLSLPTTSILTLSLQNEFGAVFVPHSLHVEMYSCEVCHPTTAPGKIEKTKKEFHALCRKCHVAEQAGPTKCRGCHQR